jgi:hypothetical protein
VVGERRRREQVQRELITVLDDMSDEKKGEKPIGGCLEKA